MSVTTTVTGMRAPPGVAVIAISGRAAPTEKETADDHAAWPKVDQEAV